MGTTLRARLAQWFPCYYGWVVFAVAAGTSYTSRPLMSVAALSVFVVPMTEEFGWSRGLFAGAVSLGGLCGVAISPVVGRLLDRHGSRLMISAASAVAGVCAVGLAGISRPWTFYALYVPGRMVFASPLELATTTAISNWFIRRRAFALALFGVTQGTGLAAMPLAAQFLITGWGWRHAWMTLGLYTLVVGVVPALLLMARRPEDMGLEPDPVPERRNPVRVATENSRQDSIRAQAGHRSHEPHFTLQQALHTQAFWVLALTQRVPVRCMLALAGLAVALGAAGTAFASTLVSGMTAAILLGSGVGGLHLLLRLAWAEYYGRLHLGTIRGFTLPVQIGGQAVGPVTAGLVFDVTGGYQMAFVLFACVVAVSSLLVLTAVPPGGLTVDG
jgi:OFA family oxalate/formate antiporter-like MFS transporter